MPRQMICIIAIIAGLISGHSNDACAQSRANPLKAAGAAQVTQISLDLDHHALLGTTQLRHLSRPSEALILELSPDAAIDQVLLNGAPVEFLFLKGQIILPPPEQENNTWTISYRIAFPEQAPNQPLNHDDPSYGIKGTISRRGVFLSGGALWYPQLSEATSNLLFHIEAPAPWMAVMAGKSLGHKSSEDKTVSTWHIPYPIQSAALSAGPYEREEGEVRGIPIYAYFFPESKHLARHYIQQAEKHLQFYMNLFGTYPFEKFAIVENFFPTGYGFTSWTLLGSSVIRLPFVIEFSLSHEIAHSWWGLSVAVDYTEGNWCEGLATYVADHRIRQERGPEKGAEYRTKLLRDYAALVNSEHDFPLSEFLYRHSPSSQAIGYGKSAMVFHMIRNLAGEDTFWKGLRSIAEKFRFQTAGWSDFQNIYEELTGKNLDGFFQQWVHEPGAPTLSLSDVRLSPVGTDWKITGDIEQTGNRLYEISVPVVLKNQGTEKVFKLPVKERRTLFSLRSSQRPISLEIDPQTHIFRQLDPSEVPETINSLKGAADITIILSENTRPEALSAAKTLSEAMGFPPHTPILSETTLQGRWPDTPVIFVGVPQTPGFKLSETSNFFAITDGEIPPPTNLFAVSPDKGPNDTSWGLLISEDPESLPNVLRKIPHYGKYSLVVFSSGVIQKKETWSVDTTPTRVRFPLEEVP